MWQLHEPAFVLEGLARVLHDEVRCFAEVVGVRAADLPVVLGRDDSRTLPSDSCVMRTPPCIACKSPRASQPWWLCSSCTPVPVAAVVFRGLGRARLRGTRILRGQ